MPCTPKPQVERLALCSQFSSLLRAVCSLFSNSLLVAHVASSLCICCTDNNDIPGIQPILAKTLSRRLSEASCWTPEDRGKEGLLHTPLAALPGFNQRRTNPTSHWCHRLHDGDGSTLLLVVAEGRCLSHFKLRSALPQSPPLPLRNRPPMQERWQRCGRNLHRTHTRWKTLN